MAPPTSSTTKSATRPSLLFSPFRRPSDAVIACLGALAAVTVLNVVFSIYTIHTIRGLLPTTHEWSGSACSLETLLELMSVAAYIGDDFPSDLPIEIPLVGLSVETGEDRLSLYDDEWGTLFPSDGFVRLGPNDRTFHVSVFHQLHCLDVIRVGFLTNQTHALEHRIQHCLRYLRQILTCHADTTLEVDIRQVADGSWTHVANGVGSVHRCKDWTVLRRWVADHSSLPIE